MSEELKLFREVEIEGIKVLREYKPPTKDPLSNAVARIDVRLGEIEHTFREILARLDALEADKEPMTDGGS